MKHLALLLTAVLCAANVHAAEIGFRFDARGQLATVSSHTPDVTLTATSQAIVVETSRGTFSTAELTPEVKQTEEGIAARFAGEGFELEQRWDTGAGFAERSWRLGRPDGEPFEVLAVREAITFDTRFERIDLHTDGSVYRAPINLFLRRKDMSLAVGAAYPWVELKPLERNGAEVRYDVGVTVAPGKAFQSERFFVVTCPYVGALCDKGGGKTRILLLDESEPMDYGEVWAMQDYVAHCTPEQPLPEDGYWVWLNGWWARGSARVLEDPKALVDRMADWGIHDIMTPEVWWGYGEHPVDIPRLAALEPGQPLPLPDSANEFISYAKSKGVHIGSFCCPSIAHFDRPGWRSVREDGTLYTYLGQLNKLGYDCWAIEPFVDAFTHLQADMLQASGGRFWAWDGRTMSFAEVDGAFGGQHDAAEQYHALPCYGKGHGHQSGRQFFQEFRNIQRMIAELRKRFPRMCLQSYWGLKRGMPWAMEGLNAQENYYEIDGIWDMALQSWFNEHYRFLPAYVNWTSLQEKDPALFETNLLLCISSSVHTQMGGSYVAIGNTENKALFRKWVDFAGNIRPYLARRRCLFGQPGSSWVTGSAHCIGDRGYLFLFRMRDPETQPAYATVPLNDFIGLTKGDRFRVTRVHPQPGRVAGVYARGDCVPFSVVNSVEVYSIEPADDEVTKAAPADLDVAEKTPAFKPGSLSATAAEGR